VLTDGPAAFGHRRLAVLDTRPTANQPMLDATGSFVIVFNGEIYNFRELRREMEKAGAKFFTDSDTEVLLEAYKAWGTACLERLNGMFAFGIWNRRDQRLFLARDRLGKKPLFYYPLPDGGIVFASELKALRLDPDIPRELNPRALQQFLSLNYILSSECILEGVRKLGPAEYLVVERGRPARPVRYWNLADKFRTKQRFRDETEAAEALADLVDDAVRLRLVSDVPLGAFLSGGLDSSTIAVSMCRLREAAATKTFSMGFTEATYSELPWARRVADALGVQHRDTVLSSSVDPELDRIVYYADEPFADTSVLPVYHLARFTRQFVTVTLSGDGADEIFGGYNTYLADKVHRTARRVPTFLIAAAASAARVLPVTRRKASWEEWIRKFLRGAALSPGEAHYAWRLIFSREECRQVLAPDVATALAGSDAYVPFEAHRREVAECHYLDQAMYVDIKTWLPDDILVKMDRATMAHSLEARAPFLDYRLVEFAASLPIELKIKGFTKKYLLKKSQASRLPAEVIHRPKEGFLAPVAHWIDSSLRQSLRDVLTGTRTKAYFNRPVVEGFFAEHRAGRADHGAKLFGLLCLGLWLSQRD
ncbi:MAG: asparagine synthase (glutamine-hydrolyzing), partial [Nitrospirales bacterium]